jgi:ABC-type lipoprotein export system ATPase subunit
MTSAAPPLLEARALSAAREGAAVDNISLMLAQGSFTAISGHAGCGRNLLLRLLGLLELPDSGAVIFQGSAVHDLPDDQRAGLRDRHFGFVFAAPFLLPGLTVVENLAMPLFRIANLSPQQARERSDTLLEFVGLSSLAEEPIDALSPFAQHCVSLARSLAHEPSVLLVEALESGLTADEHLRFAELLRGAAGTFGTAVVAAVGEGYPLSHNDRVIELQAGRIVRGSGLLREARA